MDKNISELQRIFNLQKKAYRASHMPTYQERIDRLNRLEQLTRNNIEEITNALQQDFGTRSRDWIFVADIFPQLSHVKKVKKHLKKWMRRERKSSGLLSLTGQRTYIVNEPLGVVGIVSPFNAPVSLAFDPAIDALAAGNRAMIKISESTPKTAELIKKLVSEYFAEDELAVITGDVEVSKVFTSQPWDMFFFTGGSEVGKHILAANAKNLTPTILELGGKSPCVILDDADVKTAAAKIGLIRLTNAGQVCISGDYVLLPENKLETFIDEARNQVEEAYPSIIDNENFTSIINDQSYNRITGYIDEAKAAGCRIIQCNPKNELVPDPLTRKIPMTMVVNPSKDLKVSQHEIFGPVLSIYTYSDLDDVIHLINRKEKPLALYIFGKNRKAIDKVINNTSSGGVTVNDLLMHADSDHIGFGGVGYSGMGRYKGGFIGYQAFTNPKAVHEQGLMGRFTTNFFKPYKSDRTRKMIRGQVGVK
ncbi:aldehyde dehydrogenase family protein [Aureibacter tunicatorum]|uniref:Aldehyde dehydrogenase n=1 Tax=Aureibacter tunicatorum TaxID=866807 RepID=A0AAE3XPN7_9BACT|nr:aldehyde dehydrogenase family protein [Aureibacter tunicatorum]MDR6239656.1 coniferyl-aldehyde dehydrogenase [Aureibacter tunicatorum]BDD04132.1 aldehyde dehydrogenase [Aureibacter tunicatorum]